MPMFQRRAERAGYHLHGRGITDAFSSSVHEIQKMRSSATMYGRRFIFGAIYWRRLTRDGALARRHSIGDAALSP